MQENQIEIILEKDKLLLRGSLNFSNVSFALAKSHAYFDKSPQLMIDLLHVKKSNSAAIALIIEWIKLAKVKNKSIHFYHIPDELLSIAAVSGLDKLIC